MLYFAGITLFFFIGGAAATIIRLELATPQGDLVTSDVYNRLFTIHGVIMVWFFLIPSIPNTLGNFIVPLMIGARDLAFPRLNLTSWYLFMLGGCVTLYAVFVGGIDTGWTFYTPFSTMYSNSHVVLAVTGVFIAGLLVDPHRAELHRHHPPAARAGPDLVSAAAVPVVALCDLGDPGAGDAGAGDDAAAHRARALRRHRHFRSGARAAIRSCSSICSGSTRIPPSTS